MNYDSLRLMSYYPPSGTESLYELLRSMVAFTRPRSVLEIGAGLTTVAIIEALESATKVDISKNLYLNQSYDQNYQPKFISVDSEFSQELMIQLRLVDCIEPIRSDFKKCHFEKNQFDFAFFDCGGWDEYKYFAENYWDYMQVGSTTVFHFTWIIDKQTSNLKETTFLKLLKQNKGIEFTSLIEPHKSAQGSITIVRKVTDDKLILEE